MGGFAQVIGAGVKMAGQLEDERAKRSAISANMAELDRSARLADVNAIDAIRQGEQDAGRLRMKGTDMVARQRLAFANSGVDATVGTPATVSAATSMWSELDAQTATNNAMRKAFGFQEAARKYRFESQQLDKQGGAIHIQTGLAMAGTLFGAAGGAASSSYGGG